MKNQILRLLNDLPRAVSEEKEGKLKESFTFRWRDTFSDADYDPANMKGKDIAVAMTILDVPFEFFTGSEEKIEDLLKRALKKHQTLVTA